MYILKILLIILVFCLTLCVILTCFITLLCFFCLLSTLLFSLIPQFSSFSLLIKAIVLNKLQQKLTHCVPSALRTHADILLGRNKIRVLIRLNSYSALWICWPLKRCTLEAHSPIRRYNSYTNMQIVGNVELSARTCDRHELESNLPPCNYKPTALLSEPQSSPDVRIRISCSFQLDNNRFVTYLHQNTVP